MIKYSLTILLLLQLFPLTSCNTPKATKQSRFATTETTPPTEASIVFTDIPDFSVFEGFSGTSSEVDCTSSESKKAPLYSVSQSTPKSNCRLNGSSTFTILCSPAVITGHSDVTSTLTISCTIDETKVSQEVVVTVKDVNKPPSLSTISAQTVYAGKAITSANAQDGNDDLDIDGDTLTYSCTFTGGATVTPTDCASLPSDSVSFSSSTGILAWTPSAAAAVSEVATDYSITITATDGQPTPLTDSETFTITVDIVPAPTFVSITPTSPSSNSSPVVIGSASSSVATVNLYRDSGCSYLVGTGSKATFTGVGILTSLQTNQTNDIYAQGVNGEGEISACVLMTSYEHDGIAPSAPVFASFNPSSPSSSDTTPYIIGASDTDTANVFTYTNSICTTGSVSGSKATFEGTGIQQTATANATTTFYAKAYDDASNASACTLMGSYVHDNVAPNAPVFVSTNPASPSAVTQSPKVIGTADADVSTLILYSDATCGTNIGSGTRTDFVGTGITASSASNDTLPIYAKAFDSVGNYTACTFMTNYTHDNLPPTVFTMTGTTPTSPSSNSSPVAYGAVDANSTISLYNNAGCTTSIGSGNDTDWTGAGITLSVTTNATTSIYGKAADTLGNTTSCTLLGSYIHDDTPPSAPTFVAFNPITPNNTTTTPLLQGSSAADVSYVSIYTDSTCDTFNASDDKATFDGAGITVTALANNSTGFYGKTFDALNNSSACTFLATYVHDNVNPNPPVYVSTNPASPSTTTQNPNVIGDASNDVVTVKIYSDSTCDTEVGSGTRGTFIGAGITSVGASNDTVSFYGMTYDDAGNYSACTYLTNYIHDNIPPSTFSISSITPSYPNSDPSPVVDGTVDTGATVNFYSDAVCTANIGTGSAATFGGAGITLSILQNNTTVIYGKASDAYGNLTACTDMGFTYVHNSNPPSILTFVLNNGDTYASDASLDATFTFDETPDSICLMENDGDVLHCTWTGSFSSPYTVSSNATNSSTTFYLWAKDAQGNKSIDPSTDSIIVDLVAPSFTGTATVPADGTYIVNENLDFTLSTTETVTVNTGGGTPTIALNIGGTAKTASYVDADGAGGDIGSSLRFRYTIESGLLDSDGISATAAVVLNSGTIIDQAGNNLTPLTYTLPSLVGVLVDASLPSISGAVSLPSNGWYVQNATLDFILTTSENVTVDGAPYIAFDIGGTTKNASYLDADGAGGDTGSSLRFRYTVEASLYDANGIDVTPDIVLNGGTINDSYGNALTPTSFSIGSTAGILVDSIPPYSSGNITLPANQWYVTNDNLDFVVHMNENVNVSSDGSYPRIQLDIGGSTKYATYQSVAASDITFRYTVEAGLEDGDGITVTSPLQLSASTAITDLASNDMSPLTFTFGSTAGINVDSKPPTDPTTVSPTTDTSSASYTPTWTDGTDITLDYHQMKACTSNNCSTGCLATQTPATSGGTTLTNLVYETLYYVCIQAVDSLGNASNWVSSAKQLWVEPFHHWTWISGSNTVNQLGVYGTMGDASSSNIPGGRKHLVAGYNQSSDELYVFGGYGYPSAATLGYLNDLWKWDGTNWTWLRGATTRNQKGTYGTKGVAAPTNVPGARGYGAAWTDNSGNFYIFGGFGYDSAGSLADLNDLWKWDGSNWTWISGSNLVSQTGVYGPLGDASSAYYPGSRDNPSSWVGKDGYFYIFGGWDGWTGDPKNDLWRFDGTNWAWISGSSTDAQPGVYGTKGVAAPTNVPGARGETTAWTDDSGNLYLFGGTGYDSVGYNDNLNDLWKWDGRNWTWLAGANVAAQYATFGTKGVPNSANTPGARTGIHGFKDLSGNLYLFGSNEFLSSGNEGYSDILWKWDGANWTYLKGKNLKDQNSNHGTINVPSSTNTPGSRLYGATMSDKYGNFYYYGGTGRNSAGTTGYMNDLWKFANLVDSSIATKGTHFGPVTNGGESSVKTVTIQNDSSYDMTGCSAVSLSNSTDFDISSDTCGATLSSGSSCDVSVKSIPQSTGFKESTLTLACSTGGYSSTHFTFDAITPKPNWIAGLNTTGTSTAPVYGTINVADASNACGARRGGYTWTRSDGVLYLYGGWGLRTTVSTGYLRDFWKWDGTYWVWIGGDNTANVSAVYGSLGVPAAANHPGSRINGVSFMGKDGQIYLFGGYGYQGGSIKHLSDLWKFNGTWWSWEGGPWFGNQAGTYGTKGVAEAANNPGGREKSAYCLDNSGNLYLFGGYGYDSAPALGYLSDLWKFDGTNWAWISGPTTKAQAGVWGTKGDASSSNVPSARESAACWVDGDGNFYLFGGYGYDSVSSTGGLNDFWKFDGTNWTWIGGANTVNQDGSFGTIGVAASSNEPHNRDFACSMKDINNNFYLFGGRKSATNKQSDLWKYDGTNWTWIGGSNLLDQTAVYGTKGVPDASSLPKSREYCHGWYSPDGYIYLFSGGGVGDYFNTLWQIDLKEDQ